MTFALKRTRLQDWRIRKKKWIKKKWAHYSSKQFCPTEKKGEKSGFGETRTHETGVYMKLFFLQILTQRKLLIVYL